MKKALVIADIHGKLYDKTTFSIIKQVAKDMKPDYLVWLGDCIDAEGISKFTAKNFAEGALETVEEIEWFRDFYYKQVVEACNNKKMKIIWTLGNHSEPRINEFLRKLKDSKQSLQHDLYSKLLDIKSYFPGVEFAGYNETYKIGKLYFTHGEFHCRNHAMKHAMTYGASVMYGHLHTEEVATATTKGDKKVHRAMSIPCACSLDADYKKKRSSTWINGFAEVTFLNNGEFHEHIIKIINNRTYFNNKLYTNKK